MSKIGKKPITIPENVEIKIEGQNVHTKGQKGELCLELPRKIKISKKENKIFITSEGNSVYSKAIHGLYRSLVNNLVIGVNDGYKKQLQLHGLGYRVALAQNCQKQKLNLSIGFSHQVEVLAPEGITFSVNKNTIDIEGIDKQLVGETAAKIRALRPPEPYKGKGIRYIDEIVHKKPGKAVVKTQGG